MNRKILWFVYISSMALLIAAIVIIITKRKSPEERALEDYYHGIKLYNLKYYDEAIAKFKLAVHQDPDLVDAYYYIALSTEERSYEESAEDWENYLKIIEEKGTGSDEGWDEREIARTHLAWCYYEIGMSALEKEKALNNLNKFLKLADELEDMEERIEKAEERINRIKSDEWKEIDSVAIEYYNSANYYREMGEYEEAIKKYKLAIREEPDFIDAYYYLAMTLEEIFIEESIEVWKDYLELAENEYSPDDEEWNEVVAGREHLIWAYYNAGIEEENPEKAKEYLMQFITLAKRDEGWEENITIAEKRISEINK
jgi:tetratricopeptide (TPR) repeat protein